MIFRSNLECPDLAPHFKLMSKPRHYSFGHDVPSDPDFEPDCGYFTHDEAAILYNIAREVGGNWIDIGARFGWTTAHLGAAGCEVTAVDPILKLQGPSARFESNLLHAWHMVTSVHTSTAAEFFVREWFRHSGCVIDGDHDAPQPALDARRFLLIAQPKCAIILHDFTGKPIRDAVTLLLDKGLQCRIYNTPNMLACCWRGNFDMPNHVPDPRIPWAEIRANMTDFDFSRCE